MPGTLARIEVERAADAVTVYTRKGHQLYWSGRSNHVRTWNDGSALQVLETRRREALAVPDLVEQLAAYDRLAVLLAAPSRAAKPDERHELAQLRAKAWRDAMAKAFEVLPRDEALRLFPHLTSAYGMLSAVHSAVSLGRKGKAVVDQMTAFARQEIAQLIRAGKVVTPPPLNLLNAPSQSFRRSR